MRFPWTSRPWSRAAVYGLGASGQAALELLRRGGVAVDAWDDRPRHAFDQATLSAWSADPGVTVHLAAEDAEAEAVAGAVDGVVVSPGVPADRPLLMAARARALPIIGEVELAYAQLEAAADGRDRVVGITGSNGKSTTTALTGALIEAAGRSASVCGNFGPPLSGEVGRQGREPRVFVVELSSFQLESVDTFRPHAAALLNLSPDHIDRHGDVAAYLAAKARIFDRQEGTDTAVLNADDPYIAHLEVPGRCRLFSRRHPVVDGCYLAGEQIVETAPGASPTTLFVVEDVSLAGTHNLENAMAAALLARSLAVHPDAIRRGLRTFRGLPHRLEAVGERAGVRFLDDSKGTNIGATIASLEGFDDGSVHLILGGRAKGADFGPLIEPVRTKACRVYLIGEAAAEIAATLAPAGVALERNGTLERAVISAAQKARPGESVVLSPACASFDQFTGFDHRGRAFKRLVGTITEAEEAAHGA